MKTISLNTVGDRTIAATLIPVPESTDGCCLCDCRYDLFWNTEDHPNNWICSVCLTDATVEEVAI